MLHMYFFTPLKCVSKKCFSSEFFRNTLCSQPSKLHTYFLGFPDIFDLNIIVSMHTSHKLRGWYFNWVFFLLGLPLRHEIPSFGCIRMQNWFMPWLHKQHMQAFGKNLEIEKSLDFSITIILAACIIFLRNSFDSSVNDSTRGGMLMLSCWIIDRLRWFFGVLQTSSCLWLPVWKMENWSKKLKSINNGKI